MKKKYSIKTRLLILLLILVLVPLFISSFLCIFQSTSALEETIFQHYQLKTEIINAQINHILDGIENQIDHATLSSDIQSMEPDRMDEILQNIVKVSPYISQIYVMPPSGMQIYKTSGDLGNRSDRKYFQEALKGTQNYSEVIISRSTNIPIVVFASPIKRNNSIIGVIGCSIDLDILSTLIKKEKTGTSGQAYIVEHTGKVIAHNNKEYVSKLSDFSHKKPVQEVLKKKDDILSSYKEDKLLYLAAYSYIEKTGWGVIVQISRTEAFAKIYEQIILAVIFLTIVTIISIIVALRVGRNIAKPISEIANVFDEVAQGNLKVSISENILYRKDEFGILGQAFTTLITIINNIISNLKNNSHSLYQMIDNINQLINNNNNAMQEISSQLGYLSEKARTDVMAVQESSEAIMQIAQGAENAAQHAETLNNIVNQNIESVQNGSLLINTTTESITELSESTTAIVSKMHDLESSTAQINEFVKSIIEIVEQTNLLSLNASIEAARAGEAGKGFAVVADEIHKLADKSKETASQITQIIQLLKNKIIETSQNSDNNKQKLQNVVEKSLSTRDEIENIVEVSDKAMESVQNLTSIYEEQASSSEELSANMEAILASINETSESSNNVASSLQEQVVAIKNLNKMSEKLLLIVQQMNEIISHFK